jgi:hypothetical protein
MRGDFKEAENPMRYAGLLVGCKAEVKVKVV